MTQASFDDVGLSCMEIWGGTEAAHNAVSTPGLDFYVHAQPHMGDRAGGDIHFVSVCGVGRTVRAMLADVSGHGEAASASASQLRGLMRKSMNTFDQTKMARRLNTQFASQQTSGRFATALLVTYFGPTGTLILCNAGHPRPLHFDSRHGEWSLLEGNEEWGESLKGQLRNLPLGVIDGTEYAQRYIQLGEGDLVVMYTDALTEARDGSGRMLGEGGLLDAARTLDIEQDTSDVLGSLMGRIDEHRAGDADDDQTVMVLKRNGAKAKMSLGERARVLSRMMGLAKV
ncbi:MAG: PP2C family protein-serine/threonine phosphatase [Phycisphaerales bacterium JB043]